MKYFLAKTDEVAEGLNKLHKHYLHDILYLPNQFRMTKSEKVTGARNVALVEKTNCGELPIANYKSKHIVKEIEIGGRTLLK